MKTQTLKSIIFYFLFFIYFLKANAQIVYTDVNPDSIVKTPGTHVFNLDLNNDGIDDFTLQSAGGGFGQCGGTLHSGGYAAVTINTTNLNSVAVDTNSSPLKLDSGVLLNGTSVTWKDTLNNIGLAVGIYNCSAFTYGGNWNGASDKYLGLKIISGGNIYYGWIRLNVQILVSYIAKTASFTVKDYAYNSIPNQSILAGQTCSPQATIKPNGPLSFCSGGIVVLTSKNSGNTLTYQWKKNNINIAGATNKSYTATTAGDYKVKVTDAINNCYKTSGIKTVTVPCRNSNENISETIEPLFVYPNPATNSVTIKFPSDEAGEISIVNLFGQIVYRQNLRGFQNLEGLSEMKIDISRFSEGQYIVRWNSGENFETKFFSIIK